MTDRLHILQQFLEDEPNDPFNHYALGLEYVSQQRHQEAVAKFEETIALDPAYVPAYHQLGLLFAQLQRKDEALKILEKGIQAAALEGDTHAQSEIQDAIDELNL